MTLYELSNEYAAFLEAVENGEIPDEAIADTLGAIEGEIDYKADNIACIIKQLLAESLALKAEEVRLAERRKKKEREAERLRDYLSGQLIALGKTKIETPRCKISFRRSEAVTIFDETAFLEWASDRPELLTLKAPIPNKTAIKTAINAGDIIPFAALEERQNLQLN